MRKLLMFVSLFTLACGGWLGFMEAMLRHPGFAGRIMLAASIAAISATTILARLLGVGYKVERWFWAGAVTLIGIGARGFTHSARAAHFEGFVFIISLLLVFNGALMLAILGRAQSQPLQRAAKP